MENLEEFIEAGELLSFIEKNDKVKFEKYIEILNNKFNIEIRKEGE
ncbi:TPA: hypothetical protein ACG3RE_003137 [Clostridioides difficile]